MLKNNRGITILVVILTVIVLALIGGVVVYSGSRMIATANVQNISTNMLLIQAREKTIAERAFFDNDMTKLKGESIVTSSNSVVQQLKENGVISEEETNYSKYYIWDQNLLNELEFGNIKLKEGQYYMVNYATNEVIFTPGVKDASGKIFYKLSELKDVTIEK